MTTRRLAGDDRGQMFLLAGLILALSLITLAIAANEGIHTPARESTRPSQVALGTYADYKSAVREAVRFHLTSFGITEDAFEEAVRDLGDRRRLGLAGRDVDPIVELNGTRETRLCGGTPPFANASLAGIAVVQTVDDGNSCTNAANSDGILEDENGNVVGATIDVGLMGPRYSVEETIVVTALQHRYFLRDATNLSIGATVRDSVDATDRSDGVVHRVRAPTPNVPAINGYAAVPHSLFSGSDALGSRDATWGVSVANPTDEPLEVDRVEIADTADEAPWDADAGVVDPLHPADGWAVEQDESVTPKVTNPEFDDGLTGWDDANKSVGQAEYGVKNDQPGCQDEGPSNRCLKLKTEVGTDSSDDGDVRSHYYANQTFVAPSSFDEAEIEYRYNMSADLTVDKNLLNVSIVDTEGHFNYSWESTLKSSTGWTGRSANLTTKLRPGETYTLSVHARQRLCDPDALDCTVVGDHKAVVWTDAFHVNFTTLEDQVLAWNGTTDVTVPPGTGVNFTAVVRTAEWDALLGGSADLTFQPRVRASTDGGTTYDWYQLDDPSVPGLDRAYDSLRGTGQPTVSLRLEDGSANVTSGTPTDVTIAVEEQSDLNSVPAHELSFVVPTDLAVTDHASSDCAGTACYTLAGTQPVDGGTLWTFESPATGFEAGRTATLSLTVDPPGVARSTVYRLPMQLDPVALDSPEATADGIVNVQPRSSSPHTLEMIYYSEVTTRRLDADRLIGMDVGLEMSANQAMNVTVQVFNDSDPSGWGWRTLRSGVVDYGGVSWSIGWRDLDSATGLGVLDGTGQSEVPPLPSGDPPPEGSVAIRFLHDELDTYRLDIDLAYWRVEHV